MIVRIPFVMLLCACVAAPLFAGVPADPESLDSPSSDSSDRTAPATAPKNYLGITPTFPLMGMYGLVYSRAVNRKTLLTAVGGYTNFDASPIPFLKNDNYVYENVYAGLNLTYFPRSETPFPKGFYVGVDVVPSLGFYRDRETHERGRDLAVSFDGIVGYSWIVHERIKLSVDGFINVNPPGRHISGVDMNEKDEWTVLPFFDFNVGVVF
jgi:hypothetical protein